MGAPSKDSLTNADKWAVERTSLAHDRTLLAWTRTALGIVGFGFTFYKFFEFMSEKEGFVPRQRVIGPREYALILILIGNVALLIATYQHYRARHRLRGLYPGLPGSAVPFLAVCIVVVGIFTIIATILRL